MRLWISVPGELLKTFFAFEKGESGRISQQSHANIRLIEIELLNDLRA